MVATFDSSTDRSNIADLLSQLIGEPIPTSQIPDLWVFLASLSTVLGGVTYADLQVTDAEKQRLKKILTQFMPAGNDLSQITKLMIKGVQQSKLYTKLDDLVRLTEQLSVPERLLLLAFGYEIATADGTIDPKERQYLHTVASCLQIDFQLLVVLEESFTGQPVSNVCVSSCRNSLLA
ncbi:tellurite resistance TerB family protein [Phormidesmis priestleyi]